MSRQDTISAVVGIGNSDDKLTQARWSQFVSEVGDVIENYCLQIHFHGLSQGDKVWQNAAWYFDIAAIPSIDMKEQLARLAAMFDQDSIAYLVGITEFVKPPTNGLGGSE